MTAEQLEAARSERMRQNGHGAITIEDVRTWIEETGLCIFLPRSAQAGQAVLTSPTATPTFVEAVAGQRTTEPTLELIASAESLLVRLEAEGVAVRLNLAGQPGDQPDYVVAGWVLPYIYALRGDRDWRRSPQLTGSRQVSQLAVQAAKQLDSANLTATQIRDILGREVTEAAVLRALHELWKQLRIIPVVPEVGSPALWQPLRQRFQKAIAEGASTSQVTAISVLASIYLQAVIAASMEDVEMFLSPLTSRSKIREVVRGLAATRQVHSTTMGHSPMFYVAGTLPEFPAVPSFQISNSFPAYRSSNSRGSAYLASYLGAAHDEEVESVPTVHTTSASLANSLDTVASAMPIEADELEVPFETTAPVLAETPIARTSFPRPVAHSPVSGSVSAKTPSPNKPAAPRPRSTRNAGPAHPRERSRSGSNSVEARPGASGDRRRPPMPRTASGSGNGTGSGSRTPARNIAGSKTANGTTRTASGSARSGSFSNGNGNGHHSNGNHAAKPTGATNNHARNSNGANSSNRTNGSNPTRGTWTARPGTARSGTARPISNGVKSGAGARPARPSNGPNSRPGNGTASRTGTRATPAAAGNRTAAASGFKPRPNAGTSNRTGNGTAARPGTRPSAKSTDRKPATASATKRYSFSGQAKQAPKPVAKRASAPSSKPGAKVASKSGASTSKHRAGSASPAVAKRRG